ncbi:MAG: hypothetical protein AAF799_32035 [Myxococcota bacterium]
MSVRAKALPAAMLLALGCSSAAEPPVTEECKADTDCTEGFVCAVDQGRCLPGNEAAPRAHLGFDIRERAAGQIRFRVEVDGCDCLVQEAQNIRELSLSRALVSQFIDLGVSTTSDVMAPLTGRFELTQSSRYGQLPSPQFILNYPTVDDGTMSAVPTVLRWPRYHPLDEDPPEDVILWEIEPEEDLALRYHGLALPTHRTDDDAECFQDSDCCEVPGECDPWPNFCDQSVGRCTAIGSPEWIYRYPYETACSRAVEGNVVTFDALSDPPMGAVPLADATVQFRYADPPGERFGIPVFQESAPEDRPPECASDAACDEPNEYCDLDTNQCFVALAGRAADDGTPTIDGTFRTQVYTYCDGAAQASQARHYGVTIQPAGARPQPTVDYILDATFFPAPEGSVFQVGADFCVPDWGEPVSLELELTGPPRVLVGTGDQAYSCCDIGCLPATAEDLEGAEPPMEPANCDERTSTGEVASVDVSTDFVLDVELITAWNEADCVTPDIDALGQAGSLELAANCATVDAPCVVENMALGSEETPRVYEVRVESPVGSVLASGDFNIELDGEQPELQTLTLGPRVLVTGTVDVDATICGRRESGEDCAAREAIVVAERLRMPDEPDGSVPGPYIHTVSTYHDPVAGRDGAFVLPLDPGGVYAVTALPAAGAEGGPARFAVVNLRDDASDPPTNLSLTLEEGVIVTLNLDGFDQRTSMVPVDRGSYLTDGMRLEHPGRTGTADPFIDFNRIGECWTSEDEAPRACEIRRLIPPESSLSRSQVGVVRFTARRSDQAGCSQSCPAPVAEP